MTQVTNFDNGINKYCTIISVQHKELQLIVNSTSYSIIAKELNKLHDFKLPESKGNIYYNNMIRTKLSKLGFIILTFKSEQF